jgi:hypothetical protein
MEIITRQSYGIKVSQPGYDATTAPDHKLLYNSSWPSLQTIYELYIDAPTIRTYPTINLGVFTVYVIPHNLGFYPWPLFYEARSGYCYGRTPNASGFFFDSRNLYFNNADSRITSNSIKFVIQIFNINIIQDVQYPTPQAGTGSKFTDSDFGFKIPKENKDISSSDMRDFIVHSRCQSPALVSVSTNNSSYFNSSTGYITVPLTTSYIPITAVYLNLGITNANNEAVYYMDSNLNLSFANNSLSYFVGIPGSAVVSTQIDKGVFGGIIITRDPLITPDVKKVTY